MVKTLQLSPIVLRIVTKFLIFAHKVQPDKISADFYNLE